MLASRFVNLARTEHTESLHLLLPGQEKFVKYFVTFLKHLLHVSNLCKVVNKEWKKRGGKKGVERVSMGDQK